MLLYVDFSIIAQPRAVIEKQANNATLLDAWRSMSKIVARNIFEELSPTLVLSFPHFSYLLERLEKYINYKVEKYGATSIFIAVENMLKADANLLGNVLDDLSKNRLTALLTPLSFNLAKTFTLLDKYDIGMLVRSCLAKSALSLDALSELLEEGKLNQETVLTITKQLSYLDTMLGTVLFKATQCVKNRIYIDYSIMKFVLSTMLKFYDMLMTNVVNN